MSSERQVVYKNRDGEQLGLHQSLYPSTETIDALSRHYPDAVRDIMELAKREQEFAHVEARAQLEADDRLSRRDHACRITGMWFGFLICAALLSSGVYLIVTDHGWGGYPAVVIAFFTLVGNFLNGNKPSPPAK